MLKKKSQVTICVFVAIISIAIPSICCSAEDNVVDIHTYPWWVTEEAIEALHTWHADDIPGWPEGYFNDNFCISSLDEFREVTFRHPSVRLSLHNLGEYKKGSDPHDFIGVIYGYTFSMYHEDACVGRVTLTFRNNEWVMTSLLVYQIKGDAVGDHLAILYERYKNFSDPNIVLLGAGPTFVIIENDRVSRLFSIKNKHEKLVEIPLEQFLTKAHENWLKAAENDITYRDNEEIRMTQVPTIRNWASFKKEILGKE